MLPLVISIIVFIICLALIYSEVLNRTIASMAAAVLMVVAGLFFHYYSEEQAIASVDFNTLGLLLGMMILVSILEPTGFFQYLAVSVGKLSRGKPVLLMVLLGAITSIVSMFLDNVTTIVLIAPVTILICEILGLSPRPYLMSEAILSNVGGVATLVGDPPNVLIGSASGFTFVQFLTHSLPIVVVVWFVALLSIRILFREELSKTSDSLEALNELRPVDALKDIKTAKRGIIVILGAMVLFLLEGTLHIRPALVALGASAVGLVWIRPSIQETLKRIQWDVLIFFGALFILIGGMEASGAMHELALIILRAKDLPPVLLGLILLWLVAILSAIVDNVPITIALIPVVLELGRAGIPTNALWWALVFGAGFGGNGTIVGSTANIIVTSLSEKTRTPITTKLWNKRGLPVMLITCVIASIFYVVFFDLISK